MKIDWFWIKDTMNDINENMKYLEEHSGEDKEEDKLRSALLAIDLENLKNEVLGYDRKGS